PTGAEHQDGETLQRSHPGHPSSSWHARHELGGFAPTTRAAGAIRKDNDVPAIELAVNRTILVGGSSDDSHHYTHSSHGRILAIGLGAKLRPRVIVPCVVVPR